MKVVYSKRFLREYARLPKVIQGKTDERLLLWQRNPLHPQLHNHQLAGKYSAYRSINIAGDCCTLYLTRGDETIFDQIDTHSQLYG